MSAHPITALLKSFSNTSSPSSQCSVSELRTSPGPEASAALCSVPTSRVPCDYYPNPRHSTHATPDKRANPRLRSMRRRGTSYENHAIRTWQSRNPAHQVLLELQTLAGMADEAEEMHKYCPVGQLGFDLHSSSPLASTRSTFNSSPSLEEIF